MALLNNIQAYQKLYASFQNLLLNGGYNFSGDVLNIRRRFTIAEINAGAVVLLPAFIGVGYRMVDAAMIAIGGAVTGTTTVDILATQGGASVKLLAVAIAALTQSALVRAGAGNATLLADGASHVKNDTGTAISVSKTGANLATATFVDVIFTFVLEPD